MTITFDPNPMFVEAMAAFDKAEAACSPNVANTVLDLQIADLLDALANKGIAVLIANQKAWRESAKVSKIDPRYAWSADDGAEAALVEFFTDRDTRPDASAAIRELEAGR